MVEFDLFAALVGGLVATVVMSAMMTMARNARMTDMPPMPLVMGSMMSGDRKTATAMGTMVHYIVMGTVAFGIAYAVLFNAFDNDAWWVGLLLGVAHGLVVGIMFMPMMPALHPRMTSQPTHDAPVSPGPAGVATKTQEHITVTAPGLLGRNWGAMTPVGLIMGHAVYGLVLAVLYGWIA